jgi:ubiquinone/menaquinone biosynthesis C-methylase UbiE
MQKGPGVDVIMNVHNIDLPSGSVGSVIIVDTLEHVEFPRKALEEIHRVLKPKGWVLMSSVMNFPIHEYPFDYWRFTPEGFKSLLNFFPFKIVDFLGDKEFPHTVVGLGFKDVAPDVSKFKRKFNSWKRRWDSSQQVDLEILKSKLEENEVEIKGLRKLLQEHEKVFGDIYNARAWKLVTILRKIKYKIPLIKGL